MKALHLLKLLREASRRGAGTTFCETGFNAGHASLLGLLTPNVSVVSFDLFRRPYQEVARRHLEERFPGRLRVVPGDTRATLPAFPPDGPFAPLAASCKAARESTPLHLALSELSKLSDLDASGPSLRPRLLDLVDRLSEARAAAEAAQCDTFATVHIYI